MKDLIISSSDYNHITYMIDEAQISAWYGNDVYFLLCNPNFGYCICNMLGSGFKCHRCVKYARRLLQKCTGNISILEMDDKMKDIISSEVDKIKWDYQTFEDIKGIDYKGAKVGMACLSAFITHSRNNNPLIDEEFRTYFDKVLRTACFFAEFQLRMINEINPDRIQLFNGRSFETRAASDFALQRKILLKSCENRTVFPNRLCKRYFYNSLPHNIGTNEQMVRSLWDDRTVPLVEKERIGRSFFESKYNHSYCGDKDYTVNQVATKMPDSWDNTKKNYVIFNSSEDEFSAIGGEYDQGKVFKTQYEGIVYIANLFKNRPDVNVYLRIHPNLSKIPYKYHTDLLELSGKFENFFVIRGDSDVSSYAMMRLAYRVITFGSTTGIEATYMGKPVIALSRNCYSGIDVCYEATSVEEVTNLLLTEDLRPKPLQETLKVGYFLMTPNLPEYTYFDYNFSDLKFWGRSIRRYKLAKYLGSTTLYALVGWLGEHFCKRDSIPSKEM